MLEALDNGANPATQPRDAIERLAGYKLVTLRPPGRVILTGTAKEVLLRRQYGLPLPLSQDQSEPEPPADEDAEDEHEDGDDVGGGEIEAEGDDESPER